MLYPDNTGKRVLNAGHEAVGRTEDAGRDALAEAARILRNGGLVAFPTETVYGLGAVAFDTAAVARIFEVKRRPRFDPLIVHVAGVEMLPELVAGICSAARALIARFWPGPLTLVMLKTGRVPELVTAGLETVAVRMPRHPLALELIRRTAAPLAAPSANPFGRISPTTVQHVRAGLGGKADMILDGGPACIGLESTILDVTAKQPVILRPGGLPREEIEALIGPVACRLTPEAAPRAPGMLARHYAPDTPLRLLNGNEIPPPPAPRERVGILAFREVKRPERYAAAEILSANGDLREAAANFFSAMRRLDESNLDLIEAEPAPSGGLGAAINDRLIRASKSHLYLTEQP